MRADNKGEGGSLALLALINRTLGGTKRWTGGIVLLGVFATALVLRRFDDHAGDLGPLGGRGPDHGQRRPRSRSSSRSRSASWSACSPSRRAARRGSAVFGPVMIFYFITIAVLGVMHITNIRRSSRDAQSAECLRISSQRPAARVPRHGIGRAGGDRRRGALCRHGPFRAQADPRLLDLFRASGADAQLYGPGGDAAFGRTARGAGQGPRPVLLPRPRHAPAAAGAARHRWRRSSPARR